MKITTITVQRVKNLCKYESERLEMTAEVPDEGDVEAYVILLRTKVWMLLNQPVSGQEPNLAEEGWSFD